MSYPVAKFQSIIALLIVERSIMSPMAFLMGCSRVHFDALSCVSMWVDVLRMLTIDDCMLRVRGQVVADRPKT